jgi:hypothetical protein
VRLTAFAPAVRARSIASRVSASPTPRPRASVATMTSSMRALSPLGIRYSVSVSTPTMSGSRATSSCAERQISASSSAVGGAWSPSKGMR